MRARPRNDRMNLGKRFQQLEGIMASIDQYDVAARKDVDKLHAKAVGLIGVLFLTVTGAAPISAMLFNVPIAIGYGNGIGSAASFLVATVVLTIFPVGFAVMARMVTAV